MLHEARETPRKPTPDKEERKMVRMTEELKKALEKKGYSIENFTYGLDRDCDGWNFDDYSFQKKEGRFLRRKNYGRDEEISEDEYMENWNTFLEIFKDNLRREKRREARRLKKPELEKAKADKKNKEAQDLEIEEITTPESLEQKYENGDGRVIYYGNRVVTEGYLNTGEEKPCYYGAVYKYTTKDHSGNGAIRLLEFSGIRFQDDGHAIAWAIRRAEKLEPWTYGMRSRGYGKGCQPMEGIMGRGADPEGRYHNLISYCRPLTDKEMQDYELDLVDSGE